MTEHDFVETGVSLHGAGSEARRGSPTGSDREEGSLEAGTTQRWRAEGEHGAYALAYQTFDLRNALNLHGWGVEIEGRVTLRTEELLPGEAEPPGEVTIRVFGHGRTEGIAELMTALFQETFAIILAALHQHEGTDAIAAPARAAENRAGMIGDVVLAGIMAAGGPPEFGLGVELHLSTAEPTTLTARMEMERDVHAGVVDGSLRRDVEIVRHVFE